MRIPQTAERIKEAPAQALRAVFAGVGQVLLITEKVRRRGSGESQDVAVAPQTEGASAAAETSGSAAVRDEGGQAATAENGNGHARTAEPEGVAAAETVLPVPHYSELSIASLRARLRGLDVAQVRELIAYERTHEDRANVIAMFERRIVKLEETPSADTAQG